MLIQPRKEISLLALLDPEISGGRDLGDGTWGVNLAAARLTYPDLGMKIQCPAWSNMNVGDNCKLLLNTIMVAQKTITDQVEIGERVTLFVPPQRLLSGDWDLSYEVKRVSQAAEPGPTLKLVVKLELPGGQDTNPEYGHSELSMTFDPPDVVRDGVDKVTAKQGVLVYAKPKPGDGLLYENVAVGDVIILAWAGKNVESEPVTQEQLDDPEGNPIVVLADEATILSAGDSDGVSVNYKIRDRVYNESADWCEAVYIAVDTQGLRLGAPILKQADGLIVDLEMLGDDDPLVEVWADDVNIFKKNDEIYLSVIGTDDEGKEISETAIQRIETTPPVRVSIAHKNSTLRALAKRTVVYSYHVRRGGVVVDNSRSKSRAYSVIGEPTRLAAPIAIDQISGALDPDAPEYRIRIPHDPLITTDKAIELKWFGIRADLTTYDPELEWYFPSDDEANDLKGFIVTVAGKHGKTLEGGTLDLSYNLLSDENGTITRRASLHASLLNIGEPQRELVKPIVLGEKDGVLDPEDLPGGASKITAPRPVANPTKAKDIVTYTWKVEGQTPVTDSKTHNELSKDKDVDFPLNAAFVAQHIEPNRGKTVQVSYEILRAVGNKTSYSNVLEFVIGEPVALDPPTIDSVKGSPSGKDILEGGTTVETSVVLSGTGAKGKNVEIRDGATFVVEVTADPVSGIWTYTMSGLTVTKHSFTATGKYGDDPASAAYNLTVTALIVPTLDNVLDDKGAEVPDEQTTISTSLTLKGTASKGQDVEIYDGNGASAVLKGTATADEITGLWECTITVVVGARRLFAKSLYHPTSTYSNVRLLTVEALRAPTLTSVKGSSSDNEISEDGFTVETAVILSGVAAAGRDVEVLDGTVIKGQEVADGVTGIWSLSVSDLSKARHSFTARDLRQPSLVSAARTMTVTEDVAPTMTSVKGSPSDIEIPQGGVTVETAVILSGVAAKGQQIEVFDGATSKGKATADPATGKWELPVTGLSVAAHSFTAKALYGSGAVSAARTFRVVRKLSIDQSLMTLNGVKLLQSYGWNSKEVSGNTMTRVPTGGIPEVTFTSSIPSIAAVDRTTGKVTGLKNGSAVITVRDGSNNQLSYQVIVSNVFKMIISAATDRLSFDQIHAWGLAQGGVQLPGATDAKPIIKAFLENFTELNVFLRRIDPGMDPRYKVRWQAPTKNNIVAGHYLKENGTPNAIAYGPTGVGGFEGPAFTFVPTS
ncbi:Ig-like domain-containing protein [Pseudomonas sp. B33.4]|uniref:Ig-like domain-containing protein n=1 Tax=Pseudomonas sp. B33.4 TaxID=3104265 RepID=UPI002ADEF021|nr:Ig-like domain-containing protein [Pseudomonas sp. B33.4]